MKARFCAPIVFVLGCGPARSSSMDVGASASTGADSADTTGLSACPDGVAIGPITLQTDADVAALSGCHTVEGDLHLDPCEACNSDRSSCDSCVDADALTSLAALEMLERITGSLTLGWARPIGNFAQQIDLHDCRGATSLRTLDGLDGLRLVGGGLRLHCAPALERASFPALERVGVMLVDDDGHRESAKLEVRERIPVDVGFPSLREARTVTLVGPRRTRIGMGTLERVDAMYLAHTSIASLDELGALREVGEFDMTANGTIVELGPISALERLERLSLHHIEKVTAIELSVVPSVLSISGMENLERVVASTTSEGGLSVTGNHGLVTLEVHGLREASAVHIMDNHSLTTLSGVSALERVERELRISENTSLCQSEAEAFFDALELGENAWYSVRDNADC
jgi:hypothetical protein